MNNDTPSSDDDGQWHDVAELSQLDPAFPLGVEIDGTQVGIYQEGDKVYALEDICPHAFALMSQGFQDEGVIECPLHGARFEIATGKQLNEIGQRDLRCHAVRVANGRVCVKLARE